MHKYLVQTRLADEDFDMLLTAQELFHRMDMSDCTGEELMDLYLIKAPGIAPERVDFWGTHCCRNPHTGKFDPLRMEITTTEGHLLDCGYGEDH